MKLRDLIFALESLAPPALQEGYDNAGLVFGDPETTIDSCLVCLDVTPEVLEEAIAASIPVIISHHPLIFHGIKKLEQGDPVADLLVKAIQHNIALFSVHTNLDNIHSGVNQILSDRLGIEKPEILKPAGGNLIKLAVFCPLAHADKVRSAIFEAGAGVIGNYDCCSFNVQGRGSFRANKNASPYVGEINQIHLEEEVRIETIMPKYLERQVVKAMIAAHPYEEVAYDIYPLLNSDPGVGAGMVGSLPGAKDELTFMAELKKTLGVPVLRHSALLGSKVSRVAVCGGSGSFLLEDAIRAGADAFITADVKYHQFQLAAGRILFIDAGHFETEQFTVELIARYLNDIFSNFAVHISKMAHNPVNYL